MKSLFLRKFCVLAIGLLAFGAEYANAVPAISGSYEIVSRTNAQAGAKVVVCFHLTNNDTKPVRLEGIFLWDVGRPVKSTASAEITLPSGTSEEVTQEFAVTALQLERWRRSAGPQAVLNLRTATGTKVAQMIRLQRVATGKGE